jgi:hypothetical protein
VNDRFFILDYNEAISGLRIIDGMEAFAESETGGRATPAQASRGRSMVRCDDATLFESKGAVGQTGRDRRFVGDEEQAHSCSDGVAAAQEHADERAGQRGAAHAISSCPPSIQDPKLDRRMRAYRRAAATARWVGLPEPVSGWRCGTGRA